MRERGVYGVAFVRLQLLQLREVQDLSKLARLAGSRLTLNECARDDRRRLETSGRWSPLEPNCLPTERTSKY